MNLKGVRELNKAVTNLVHEYITDEIYKCKFTTIFCMGSVDDTLYFSLFQDELVDNLWYQWLKATYGDRFRDSFSLYVLTFLHEIGHFYTLDDFDDEYEEYTRAKNSLVVNYEYDTDAEIIEKNFTYWDLPIEKAATDWAIDFYNDHEKELKMFYMKLMTVISNFYNTNYTGED